MCLKRSKTEILVFSVEHNYKINEEVLCYTVRAMRSGKKVVLLKSFSGELSLLF